jgi:phosphoribosyl 1,2-cyclic phosphate phosphodiesterase
MTGELHITILGCGSSAGVPRIGGPDGAGDWGVCDPTNPKNRRRRCSLLVRRGEPPNQTAVLVDTTPDLREQLLSARCGRLDGVVMTHPHGDQTHGIDDLRPLIFGTGKRTDMYADAGTLDNLMHMFSYCFVTPPNSPYPPIINGHVIPEPFAPFDIVGPGGPITVRAFWQQHGMIRSLGFRFGGVAYSSDVNELGDDAFAALEGVDVWIVDALRYRPHPSHAGVETALAWLAHVKPKRGILTNMTGEIDYETLRRELPPGVEPAYDGMNFMVHA